MIPARVFKKFSSAAAAQRNTDVILYVILIKFSSAALWSFGLHTEAHKYCNHTGIIDFRYTESYCTTAWFSFRGGKKKKNSIQPRDLRPESRAHFCQSRKQLQGALYRRLKYIGNKRRRRVVAFFLPKSVYILYAMKTDFFFIIDSHIIYIRSPI